MNCWPRRRSETVWAKSYSPIRPVGHPGRLKAAESSVAGGIRTPNCEWTRFGWPSVTPLSQCLSRRKPRLRSRRLFGTDSARRRRRAPPEAAESGLWLAAHQASEWQRANIAVNSAADVGYIGQLAPLGPLAALSRVIEEQTVRALNARNALLIAWRQSPEGRVGRADIVLAIRTARRAIQMNPDSREVITGWHRPTACSKPIRPWGSTRN